MKTKFKKISLQQLFSWLLGFVLGFSPTGLIPGSIGISPIFLFLMCFLGFLGAKSKKFPRFPKSELSLFLVLFTALSLVYLGFTFSSLKYYNFNAVNYLSVNFQYLYSMLLFPSILYIFFEHKAMIMLKGYVMGVFLLMFFAYLVYLVLGYEGARSLDWVQTNARLTLWMGANTLAIHLVLGIIIIFIQAIDSPIKYKIFKLPLLFIFMFIPVMLTGSVGGLLILFLTLSFLIFLRFPKLSIVNLPVLFAVLSLLVYYLLNFTEIQTVQRYVSLFSGDIQNVSSYSDRQEGILLGLEIIAQDSYFGVGAGEAYINMDEMVGFKTIPHNALIMLWLEGGVLALLGGLLWFVVLIGWIFINFEGRKLIYLLSILLAISLYWMTRTHAYQIYLYAPLAILLSLYKTESKSYVYTQNMKLKALVDN